ncbi:hypothetical protein GXW82_37945 [Streptacidiphilus sp. 4-A2]|nr:hypothetical protein [Streptacidiphilus sp. 4-A2]
MATQGSGRLRAGAALRTAQRGGGRGIGVAAIAVPVFLLWVLSPYVEAGSGGVLRLSACLWLMAHGAVLRFGGTPLGVPPLLLTVPALALLYRTAVRAAREAGAERAGSLLAGVCAGYLLVGAAALVLAVGTGGPPTVAPAGAAGRLLLVALPTAVAGVRRGAGAWWFDPPLSALLPQPSWSRPLLRGAGRLLGRARVPGSAGAVLRAGLGRARPCSAGSAGLLGVAAAALRQRRDGLRAAGAGSGRAAGAAAAVRGDAAQRRGLGGGLCARSRLRAGRRLRAAGRHGRPATGVSTVRRAARARPVVAGAAGAGGAGDGRGGAGRAPGAGRGSGACWRRCARAPLPPDAPGRWSPCAPGSPAGRWGGGAGPGRPLALVDRSGGVRLDAAAGPPRCAAGPPAPGRRSHPGAGRPERPQPPSFTSHCGGRGDTLVAQVL